MTDKILGRAFVPAVVGALALTALAGAGVRAQGTPPPKPAAPAQVAPPASKPAAPAGGPAAPKPAEPGRTGAAADKPPAPPASPQGAGAVPPPGQVPPPAEGYAYRSEGRRDPFVSLTARAVDPRAPGKRPEGIAGLLVSEIALRGVIHGQGKYLATVQGPDMKSYLVRPGDRFLDGVVKTITADSLIILVEVNDPLSLTKQREVRKTLRVVEEVK